MCANRPRSPFAKGVSTTCMIKSNQTIMLMWGDPDRSPFHPSEIYRSISLQHGNIKTKDNRITLMWGEPDRSLFTIRDITAACPSTWQ